MAYVKKTADRCNVVFVAVFRYILTFFSQIIVLIIQLIIIYFGKTSIVLRRDLNFIKYLIAVNNSNITVTC